MGNINVYNKIMIENQKTRENMEINNLRLKDRLQMEFTAC